jgi:hypothetical protein
MRVLAVLFLIVVLVTLPVVAQDQEKRMTITGWPPYTFGADLNTIMQTNSTLKKECVLGGQRVREAAGLLCAQGIVDAPIGGQPYRVSLFLEFRQDHLETLMLMWTFEDLMSRRNAKDRLESELRANYAAELWRGTVAAPLEVRRSLAPIIGLPRPDDATVYLSVLRDAQGNVVSIVDVWGQQNLLLLYSPAKAAGTTPLAPPPAKY